MQKTIPISKSTKLVSFAKYEQLFEVKVLNSKLILIFVGKENVCSWLSSELNILLHHLRAGLSLFLKISTKVDDNTR